MQDDGQTTIQSDSHNIAAKMKVSLPASSDTDIRGRSNQRPAQQPDRATATVNAFDFDLVPLLPGASNSQHLMERSRSVDPQLVDLEQAPKKQPTKPNSIRRKRQTARVLTSAMCLLAGIGIFLTANPFPNASPPNQEHLLPYPPDILPLSESKPLQHELPTAARSVERAEVTPKASTTIEPEDLESRPSQTADLKPALAAEKTAPQDIERHAQPTETASIEALPPTNVGTIRSHEIRQLPPSTDAGRDNAQNTHLKNKSPQKAANSSLALTTIAPPPAPNKSNPRPIAPTAALEKLDTAKLLAEGQRLFETGEISSARAIFQIVVNRGAASGALALGSTYDAKTLVAIGLPSHLRDTNKALKWYRQAHLMAQAATQN